MLVDVVPPAVFTLTVSLVSGAPRITPSQAVITDFKSPGLAGHQRRHGRLCRLDDDPHGHGGGLDRLWHRRRKP